MLAAVILGSQFVLAQILWSVVAFGLIAAALAFKVEFKTDYYVPLVPDAAPETSEAAFLFAKVIY